jgi:hypothetical protein
MAVMGQALVWWAMMAVQQIQQDSLTTACCKECSVLRMHRRRRHLTKQQASRLVGAVSSNKAVMTLAGKITATAGTIHLLEQGRGLLVRMRSSHQHGSTTPAGLLHNRLQALLALPQLRRLAGDWVMPAMATPHLHLPLHLPPSITTAPACYLASGT